MNLIDIELRRLLANFTSELLNDLAGLNNEAVSQR
jgi:hypothetical protein